MKKLAFISFVLFLTSISVFSQNIITNNTEAIQNYFYQNQSTKVENNLDSDTNIYQIGENNNIDIDTSEDNIQLVRQVGDANNYQYYTYYNSSKANLVINQFGDENDIQIYGHNSIVEKLKITQTTNNQNVLIYNY